MFMKFVVNTVTLLLMVYNSFNAYKARKNNLSIRKHYSYYFIVMGLLLSFDSQMAFITNFLPFYQFVKLITVIWLSIPVCSGSMFIYKFYLTLVFRKNERKIDNYMEKIRMRIYGTALFYYNMAYSRIKKRELEPLGSSSVGEEVKEMSIETATKPPTDTMLGERDGNSSTSKIEDSNVEKSGNENYDYLNCIPENDPVDKKFISVNQREYTGLDGMHTGDVSDGMEDE